ncbi:MAG: hypothetical protein R3A13_10075 [Bdellovibrionota bacterium]
MLRLYLVKFILVFACLICGCALPTPERVEQDFVPDVEIQGAALVREGMYYFRKSRYFEAEASLRKAEYLFPEADNIKASLAVVLQAGEQPEESVSIFKKLIEANPDVIEYQIGLARVYYANTDYDLADELYEKVYQLILSEAEFQSASTIARSLSALNFRIGNEVSAYCYSEEAFKLEKKILLICKGILKFKLLLVIMRMQEIYL